MLENLVKFYHHIYELILFGSTNKQFKVTNLCIQNVLTLVNYLLSALPYGDILSWTFARNNFPSIFISFDNCILCRYCDLLNDKNNDKHFDQFCGKTINYFEQRMPSRAENLKRLLLFEKWMNNHKLMQFTICVIQRKKY